MRQKNTVKRTADTVIPVKTSVSRWQLFCLLAAVVVITLISFSPAIDNSFINQDDNIYVFDNADIGKPVPEAIAYFFGPHYFSGNYIPLTMTAYTFAWHKAGTQPEFYHTLNIFIHLLNVVLVFGLVYLLSRKKAGVAAIVSLFFGIHPMHVESVAWASELKDVLYTFFFLAGLIAYYKYCERACEKLHPETGINLKPGEQNPFIKNGYGLLLITFVCFVFSVLSKPAAIIFPVVLLLFDFYRRRPSGKTIWLEKLPFFMVSVIFGIIAIKAQQADNLISDQYPLAQRLIFASYALLAYLVKFILPVNLSNFYPYPPLADGHLPYLYYIAPVAVVLLFYGIYRTLKYTRLVAFGFLFFFANLILVLQFVSVGNAIMADRYTYVPYIGLLFIIAMGFDQVYHSPKEKLKAYKPLAVTIIIVLAMACSFLTYARCKVWENQDTISIDLLNNFPDNAIALNNRGYLLYLEGNYPEAITLFRQAIKLKPNYIKWDYVKAYINLADCYIAMKDYNNAQKVIDDGLQYAPHDHDVLNKMGCILAMQGEYPAALKFFNEAVFYKKDDIKLYLNMAHCYYNFRDYKNWEITLDTGLKYAPDNYLFLNDKGYALFLKGNYNNALTWFKASLERKPGFETAQENLSNCYRAINDSLKTKANE